MMRQGSRNSLAHELSNPSTRLSTTTIIMNSPGLHLNRVSNHLQCVLVQFSESA